MRTVKFTSKKLEEGSYAGNIQVQGYQAIDYGTSHDEVKSTLIAHLLEEGEIVEGNFVVEETLT